MKRFTVLFFLIGCLMTANARISLPSVFSDNMVLQQNTDAAFWGEADAGDKVVISPSWSSERTVVTAGSDGRWFARVGTAGAGGPYRIAIKSGKDRIVLENVLLGEVWICSGQSNMEMPMKGFDGQPVKDAAYYICGARPEIPIRSCNLRRVKSLKEENDCPAEWYVHDSEGVSEASATAYFFALRLYETLHIPIGIINASWGGTPIEAWMDTDLLEDEFAEDFDLGFYERGEFPKNYPYKAPGVLYNGMLHSLIPFTAKGFIWYQGCQNRDRYEQYKRLQPAFVRMLREQWGNGDMPFYFTQIAPYSYGDPDSPTAGYMMWAQAQTLEMIPHSGMAATHDSGELDCIHPSSKKNVGDRLAFLALVNDYGIKGFDPDPPIYESVEYDGAKAIVKFRTGKTGLCPMYKTLTGFELAGDDHVFHPAAAVIVPHDRSKIEVTSPEVTAPVAVRYGMKNWSEATLFNCYGIPASPFRTDGRESDSVQELSFDVISQTEHPRLFLKQGEETRIAEAVGKFPAVARMHGIVMDWADSALSLNPVTRKMEGIRLLETSRESLKRVFALSYAWRMTGNPAYAERAEREMLACCSFEDWNPSHFLDVAEMSLSMAIGYDWLYDVLSLQTIEKIRDAVFEKAFVPVETSSQPWYGYSSNWNSVCNAGLTAAAVAFYEDAPKRCSDIVSRAIESNPKVMASYAPDGGYPEGYMYWAYGTAFEILLIDALEGVCSTDFGLSEYPGFMESGRFVQAMLTPSGGCFNFSDASYGSASTPMLFWMARRTGDLSLLYSELEYIGTASNPVFREERLLPFAIICASTLDLDRVSPPDWNTWSNGGETPVFTYRSGWESPYDTYFGIKGGTPVTGHSHLDGGSFIYEKDSIRWALDLGMQNYYSLEKYGLGIWSTSQGSDRWKVFRYTDRSHNTVSVPGCLHRVGGRAEIVDTFSSASRKGAEVDMTTLLPQFRKVSRTAFLDADDNLHMEDLFVAGDSSHTVVWMMNTEAEPEILSDDEIRLSCRNREMTVRFRATSPFRLGIFPNDPPEEYDAPNPGTVRIGLTMEVGPGDTAVINADFRYLGEMVPQIIFDTDMGNDIDDALALAMLYKYNDDGKIGLKAVMLNKEGSAAPEFMDIMGTWYGYPDIPVGIIRDGAECGGDAESYTRKVMEMKTPEGKPLFGRTHSDYGDYPESVTLYRKLLSEAADSSLTIVSVGFFTNLARLLESGPDSFSELSGRELVGRKVRNLVAMAGCISDTTNYEYNVVLDIPSAKKVLTEWPVDVILSPFELGLQVCYPASSIENDFEWTEHHPVEEAYRFFMQMPYDRPSWDMTAVLAAVENSPEYFTVSPAGTISVSDNGSTVFSEGNGNRYYLSVTPEQAENIKDRIISLVTAVPLSFGR